MGYALKPEPGGPGGRGWQALTNLMESGEGTLDRRCHVHYGLKFEYRFHSVTERANVVRRPELTEIPRGWCLIG